MSLLHHVTTHRCDKCGEGKPIRGGLQMQRGSARRFIQSFVCWDCLLLHIRKHQAELSPKSPIA